MILTHPICQPQKIFSYTTTVAPADTVLVDYTPGIGCKWMVTVSDVSNHSYYEINAVKQLGDAPKYNKTNMLGRVIHQVTVDEVDNNLRLIINNNHVESITIHITRIDVG